MDDGLEDEDDRGEEGAVAPEDQDQLAAAAAVPPEPHFLTTAWSFISTLITSLVPEGRRQPAN